MPVCNQITLLIHYYVSSRLLNLLKVTDAPVQTSDFLVLTVCVQFITINCKIISVFVPEVSTSIMTYIV